MVYQRAYNNEISWYNVNEDIQGQLRLTVFRILTLKSR